MFVLCHGFHGNSFDIGERAYRIKRYNDAGFSTLLVSWRGFSGNKGNPTEEGLYKDARSAVEWLKSNGVYEKDIIIYGESLGTGIATEIAQNSNFAGLVLETPFTSMIDAGKDKYPFLPVKLLLKDKYETEKINKNFSQKVKTEKSSLLVKFNNSMGARTPFHTCIIYFIILI